jgi:phenylalanyl-tRNA synthetase alpha chain
VTRSHKRGAIDQPSPPRRAPSPRLLPADQAADSPPPIHRDISPGIRAAADVKTLGCQPRDMLGARAPDLESVELLALTSHRDLPEGSRNRLQLNGDHANALLRGAPRPLTGTLTDARANRIRDEIPRPS